MRLFPIPFGTKVKVRFSDPIQRVAGEDSAALLDTVRDVIDGTLTEWRADA